MPGGKAQLEERHRLAATGCSVHPDRCAPRPAAARCRTSSAAPGAPARLWPACPAQCPERESKFALCREPFCQPNTRDMALLLRRFAKFCGSVILQPAPENLQNFRRRLPRSAHDEDMAKAFLVFLICLRQRDFHSFTGSCDVPLLLR